MLNLLRCIQPRFCLPDTSTMTSTTMTTTGQYVGAAEMLVVIHPAAVLHCNKNTQHSSGTESVTSKASQFLWIGGTTVAERAAVDTQHYEVGPSDPFAGRGLVSFLLSFLIGSAAGK